MRRPIPVGGVDHRTVYLVGSRMLNCMPLRSTLVPAGFVILRDASGPRSKQNQLAHNHDTIKSKLARRANLHVLDHTHPCMPCTSARVRPRRDSRSRASRTRRPEPVVAGRALCLSRRTYDGSNYHRPCRPECSAWYGGICSPVMTRMHCFLDLSGNPRCLQSIPTRPAGRCYLHVHGYI